MSRYFEITEFTIILFIDLLNEHFIHLCEWTIIQRTIEMVYIANIHP